MRSTVFNLTGVHFQSELYQGGDVDWQKKSVLDQAELGNP